DDIAAMDARYGRTPKRRRRDRIIMIVAGFLFGIVVTAWVVWAGLDGTRGSLATQDIAYSNVDDANMSVTWQVSVKSGTPVSCALQAQNEAHAIVGWKIVEIAPAEAFTNRYQEDLRTSQRAVTGLIYQCWLT